jgi:hypothetical protein
MKFQCYFKAKNRRFKAKNRLLKAKNRLLKAKNGFLNAKNGRFKAKTDMLGIFTWNTVTLHHTSLFNGILIKKLKTW